MKKKILIVLGIALLIIWSSISVSCLTTDTAYRVGYDIGSSLAN